MKIIFLNIKLFKNWILVFIEKLLPLWRLLPKYVMRFRNGLLIKVRTNTSDSVMVREVFIHKPYDFKLGEINNKEEINIIDIGAAIGEYSLYAANKYPNSKIYSFEPFPESFDLLKENIKLNNYNNQIFPFNIAVSDNSKGEVLSISKFGNQDNSTHNPVNGSYKSSIKTSSTTINEIILKNNLDEVEILKLDCEGAEWKILFCSDTILNRIRFITLELHNYEDYKPKDLVAFLEKNNFKVNQYSAYLEAVNLKFSN